MYITKYRYRRKAILILVLVARWSLKCGAYAAGFVLVGAACALDSPGLALPVTGVMLLSAAVLALFLFLYDWIDWEEAGRPRRRRRKKKKKTGQRLVINM